MRRDRGLFITLPPKEAEAEIASKMVLSSEFVGGGGFNWRGLQEPSVNLSISLMTQPSLEKYFQMVSDQFWMESLS